MEHNLELHESTLVVEEGASAIQPDGTVLMHVIRPGLGRGRGKHLYEAKMLSENAHKFTGWKMYVNHLSPEAKRAAGGLPRDVRDLGGRIVESWWDPSVPGDDRFGQGAVVARAKPTPFIRDLIENDPEIVEASISATATGVRPGQHAGARCWIVEGIEDRGSVDWVTEAGAGGKVVSLLEAAMEHDEEGRIALLASMTDEEFVDYMKRERPNAAERVVRESEEDPVEITPEMLTEALADEGLRNTLLSALNVNTLVEAAVETAVEKALEEAGQEWQEQLPQLLEAALETERALIRATARADADRRVQITEMRSTAHKLAEAAKLPSGKPLPERFVQEIKEHFDIVEGEPTPALNVVDDIDDNGEVTKKAEDKLTEAVEAEVKKAIELVAAANPARVRGQGPSVQEGEEGAKGGAVAKGSLLESLFTEAGFEDPSKVYDLSA
jgi:hypothetical protein